MIIAFLESTPHT